MRRTPIRLAAVLLAAGLAAAACGSVKMGSAALVGDQRISTTGLSGEVSNLNAGYQTYKRKIQLQYPVSQMPQQVLGWLVRFQVRDRMAQREGISVSPTDVQQALAAITASIKQNGGSGTLPEVAVANGLPPDMISELGNYQAIETKLLNHLDGGTLPTSTSGQQALESTFNGVQCRAAKSLDIQINPQFGVLNYSTFAVVPLATSLSRSGSGPAPSPKPTQTNPPC